MDFQVYLLIDPRFNDGEAYKLRFCLRMVYVLLWDSTPTQLQSSQLASGAGHVTCQSVK